MGGAGVGWGGSHWQFPCVVPRASPSVMMFCPRSKVVGFKQLTSLGQKPQRHWAWELGIAGVRRSREFLSVLLCRSHEAAAAGLLAARPNGTLHAASSRISQLRLNKGMRLWSSVFWHQEIPTAGEAATGIIFGETAMCNAFGTMHTQEDSCDLRCPSSPEVKEMPLFEKS